MCIVFAVDATVDIVLNPARVPLLYIFCRLFSIYYKSTEQKKEEVFLGLGRVQSEMDRLFLTFLSFYDYFYLKIKYIFICSFVLKHK